MLTRSQTESCPEVVSIASARAEGQRSCSQAWLSDLDHIYVKGWNKNLENHVMFECHLLQLFLPISGLLVLTQTERYTPLTVRMLSPLWMDRNANETV